MGSKRPFGWIWGRFGNVWKRFCEDFRKFLNGFGRNMGYLSSSWMSLGSFALEASRFKLGMAGYQFGASRSSLILAVLRRLLVSFWLSWGVLGRLFGPSWPKLVQDNKKNRFFEFNLQIWHQVGTQVGTQVGLRPSKIEAEKQKKSMLKNDAFSTSILEGFRPHFGKIFGRFFERKINENCKSAFLAKTLKKYFFFSQEKFDIFKESKITKMKKLSQKTSQKSIFWGDLDLEMILGGFWMQKKRVLEGFGETKNLDFRIFGQVFGKVREGKKEGKERKEKEREEREGTLNSQILLLGATCIRGDLGDIFISGTPALPRQLAWRHNMRGFPPPCACWIRLTCFSKF